MNESLTSEVVHSQTLINENPPPQPFLSRFQRWEWILVGLIILRDVVIVTGAIVYHMRIEKLEAAPSVVSKLNTFAQILLILAVMFSQAVRHLPSFWMDVLIYTVLVTTLWSGFDYVWTWGRRAWLRREL